MEVAALKAFRDRVNGLLENLDGGAGSTLSISAQVMTPGHPGIGFTEVNAMVSRYQETHTKLVQLSQALSSAIDAMTISIDVARLGYENVDAQEIARLWAIHDQEVAAAGPTQVSSQPGGESPGSGDPRTGAL
ncbi:hypothetical protein [Streptacidiphilus jiangxiensis]|uniref:Uncharacterized protein n=1 Tax=Streptacidiphilus jiangxiensis TaxID=235985 RepID=A0A1H7RER0_STRJI|nr:hypothetical protein [Streptacidiphilus jiangxiensis]SEL58569.1 hypothetical protein SAMN05414137_11085 [Streptacidiphilus jiangxiensis]